MKKLNSYIVEKLRIDKHTKEQGDIEDEILELLSMYNEDLDIEEVLGYAMYNDDGDQVDYLWVVNAVIRYSTVEDASGSTVLNDLSELFTMEEIQKIYDYLLEHVK